jgi:hypothetical protein
VALLTQLPWQQKLSSLELEVAELRARLDATTQELASLQASQTLTRVAALSEPKFTDGSSLTRQGSATEEPVTSLDELALLTEDQLAQTVAGAGVPPPGPVALTGPMPEGGESEQAATRLVPRLEKGGILLPKGKMQVEPSISYSHVSNNRVALSGFSVFDVVFIGQIRSDDVDRDIITPSVGVRYGLGHNLQAELDLPTQYRREETVSGPIDERTSETSVESGFGDTSLGLFYQFAREQGMRPNMIALMKLKMPTGTSPVGSDAWGLKSGLVMVKNSDPVVLFSNVGYTVNFPSDVNGIEINHGNSFEYSAGMAYALNYHLAVNGSFEQIFIGETETPGASIAGSRLVVANFKTGLTYAFTKNFSMDFSVGTGLTEDSPDLTVSLSFPYTF